MSSSSSEEEITMAQVEGFLEERGAELVDGRVGCSWVIHHLNKCRTLCAWFKSEGYRRSCQLPSDVFHYKVWKDNYGKNNCFDFAVDDLARRERDKSVPMGSEGSLDLSDCKDMNERFEQHMQSKEREFYKQSWTAPCRPGFYKVSQHVAKERDFHYYRLFLHAFLSTMTGATTGSSLRELAAFARVPA